MSTIPPQPPKELKLQTIFVTAENIDKFPNETVRLLVTPVDATGKYLCQLSEKEVHLSNLDGVTLYMLMQVTVEVRPSAEGSHRVVSYLYLDADTFNLENFRRAYAISIGKYFHLFQAKASQ
jgi:hypothetical protein